MAETNAKSSDKFGKGLSKLKQGVLGKSMEGVIVDPLDPALDVANFCNVSGDIFFSINYEVVKKSKGFYLFDFFGTNACLFLPG